MIKVLIPVTLVFCAGACLGLGLATHELNRDFKRLSYLMTGILMFAAGLLTAYMELISGQ